MNGEEQRFNTIAIKGGSMFDVRSNEATQRISELSKVAGASRYDPFAIVYTQPIEARKLGEDQPMTRAPDFSESRVFNKQCEDMIERMSKLAAGLAAGNGEFSMNGKRQDENQPMNRAPDFSESRLFNSQCENITKIHQNYMTMCKETTAKQSEDHSADRSIERSAEHINALINSLNELPPELAAVMKK